MSQECLAPGWNDDGSQFRDQLSSISVGCQYDLPAVKRFLAGLNANDSVLGISQRTK